MNSKLYALFPKSLKRCVHHFLVKRKYDVLLGKGATAHDTVLEGKNSIGIDATVSNSRLGKGTYVSGYSSLNNVCVGRFCSIGRRVFIGGFGTHPTNWVSTHPAFFSTKKQAGFTYTNYDLFPESKYVAPENKYHVVVGNDVWIGNNVIILNGITIADGAIIGTGAVVTKNIAPYAIVGGVPARIIRYRFDDETINKLLDLKWWGKDEDWLRSHCHLFNDVSKIVL
jgi:acetyltransferase-like isoleucine patch superfamily enzyme